MFPVLHGKQLQLLPAGYYRTFRANMDIQYNGGSQAICYLAKYMAKNDYSTSVSFKGAGKSDQGYYQKIGYVKGTDHLKTRIIGAVEATYNLLSLNKKHCNSRNVIFINTALFGFDSLCINYSDIHDLPEDSTDIFAKSQVQVYEKRDGAKNLTMPEFYCFYIRTSRASDEETNAVHEMVNRNFYTEALPKFVKSEKTEFVLRTRDRIAYWRTYNQTDTNSDAYYYRQASTKKSSLGGTLSDAKGTYHSWKDYYEYLISTPP
ncbi:hypothetical protein MBANPS3_003665 [Mucor bainieri]